MVISAISAVFATRTTAAADARFAGLLPISAFSQFPLPPCERLPAQPSAIAKEGFGQVTAGLGRKIAIAFDAHFFEVFRGLGTSSTFG